MEQAFNIKGLSITIALAVVLTGIVSSATLVNGFAGYFREFVSAPDVVMITLVCITLGIVAIWGIAESVNVAVAITLAELLGLIAVVIVALPAATNNEIVTAAPQALQHPAFYFGVLSGAGIAFYAFIGFEDMVNVAEEVKNVRHVMPKAIILTLVVTTILYFIVATVVVRSMPLTEFINTEAPLAKVFSNATGSSTGISIIALFAVINGALIQVLMAARVLYGAGKKGWLPNSLAKVNHTTQTPIMATVLVTVLVLIFALWLPLGTLARLTSLIILVIFTIVNIALLRIKMRSEKTQQDLNIYRVPLWIPIAGATSSGIFAMINGLALM